MNRNYIMRRITDISKIYKSVLNKELIISENGEIWRIAKRGWDRWSKNVRTNKCKKVRAEHDVGEYLTIRTMYNGRRFTTGAHRLVYFHFYGKIPKGKTVNHKDGNKKNNHPNNLELLTDKQQIFHARNVLKRGKLDQNGDKNNMSKLTKRQVKKIIQRRKKGEKLLSIAKDYDITFQHVSRLYKKQRWGHLFKKAK